MIRRLMVMLIISGAICLLGATATLAQLAKQYELKEYESLVGEKLEFNQAPALRVLVAAGELDPLEERLPNIAKDWTFSQDAKILTLYLRKGLKWSDGVPFTADDIMFWYEDILLNDQITTSFDVAAWSPGGEVMKMEKIDDYIRKR